MKKQFAEAQIVADLTLDKQMLQDCRSSESFGQLPV